MRPALHVYEPSSSTELNKYLDGRRCDLAVSFDEAPKLAHSIAIELDDALDSAMLSGNGGEKTVGMTVIISEVEDMEVAQACLSALGSPAGAALLPRDFDQDRQVGFCYNGEHVTELQAPLQPILDATAVLADELDEHFEFSVSTRKDPGVVLYGGRAPDGCIIGVLGVR